MNGALDATRRDLRRWLAEAWDADLALRSWRERLADAGWARPQWPVAWYGRGLTEAAAVVVAAEIARARLPGPPAGPGIRLIAPTLLAHADRDLKAALLRPILTGVDRWCQLLSEPGSGSDLASVTTLATREPSGWCIEGRKVWVSGAPRASHGFLLARTDRTSAKHRGLTCFALPMRQPAVTIRPIRQMNGYSSFYEVTMHGARVPDGFVVGEVGDGWSVVRTALSHERQALSTDLAAPLSASTGAAGAEEAAEALEESADYVWYPQRTGAPEQIIEVVAARRAGEDPRVRQAVAMIETLRRVEGWTRQRADASGSELAPVAKLLRSAMARRCSALYSTVLGPGAMAGADHLERLGAEVVLSVPAVSIGGGTDEIQRNLLGERVLGLPREPPGEMTHATPGWPARRDEH